jgi:predicted deacylase
VTNMDEFEVGSLRVRRGERSFTRLPVTSLLLGAELSIPLHVIHGAKEGPVLGLISGIHGPEHFVIRILREVILKLNPEELAGTVLAIPVANPVAFARAKRSTPEEDIDFADMNRVFPGVRAKPAFGGGESLASDRSLTEWMAAVISEEFFPRLHYLIDFHCHFSGCALIETIVKTGEDDQRNKDSFEMNRLFNVGIMHESGDMPPVTATGYANKIGVTTAVAEIGGGGLSGMVQKKALHIGVDGVFNVMRYLKMVPGDPIPPGKQLHGTWQPHVRPTKAGYLLTEFEPDSLFEHSPLGVPVHAGDLLGTVFDLYTFEEIERLYVPADGVLYLCRTSGPVEAGSHAYAVTAYEGGHWVE